jgi:hypothetical protein
MKKMIICLVIALTLMSLCACSEANTYTVLEVGGYDNFSGANHMEDITLDNENYSKVLVIPQKTVKINGNDWKVEYCGSQKGYLYKNDLDNYTRDEDGVFVDIGINKDTGTVDSYMWVDQEYVESQTGAELTEEECLDIAKTYLGDYVKTDEYEVVNVRYLEIPEYKAIYDFEFARVIDGIKTSDTAYIGVSVFGDVISHLFVSLGELADAEAPTEDEMEIIQNNVNAKLDAIYENVSSKYDISFEIEDTVLVRLSNGKYAMEYYVRADLVAKDTQAKITESTKLLVYLD